MSPVEHDQTTGEKQFPVIDPQYFTNQFQPALYELFVEEGEDEIPGVSYLTEILRSIDNTTNI